jgi:hypothetical protein
MASGSYLTAAWEEDVRARKAAAEKAFKDPAGSIFSSDTALDGRNPARDAQMSSLDPFKILKGQDDKTNEYFRNQTMSGVLSKTQPIMDAPQVASPGQYQIQTIDRTPQIQESPYYRQRQDEAQRLAMQRSQGAGPSMAGLITQQSRDAALLGQMGAAQGARGGYSPLTALAAQRATAPAIAELARVGATQTAQEIGAGQTAYAGISQQQRAQDLALAQQNAALDQSIKLANANAEQQRYMAMGAADQRIGLANAGTTNDIAMANAGAQLRDMQLHAQAARDQASLLGGTTSISMGLLIGEQQRQQQIKAAEEQLRYKLGVAERNKEIADELAPADIVLGAIGGIPIVGGIVKGAGEAALSRYRS